jgi:hypothetical protein
MEHQPLSHQDMGRFEKSQSNKLVLKPRPDHLVYTGLGENGEVQLYIHVADSALHQHDCYIFRPRHHTQDVLGFQGPSAKIVVEELGWFRGPGIFRNICMNIPVQPVPLGVPNHLATYKRWVRILLATLSTHYQQRWTRNDSNWL